MDRILASEAGDPSSNLGGSATSRKGANAAGKRSFPPCRAVAGGVPAKPRISAVPVAGKPLGNVFVFLRIGTPGISPQNAFFAMNPGDFAACFPS